MNLRADGETMASLAFAVPQVDVPDGVRRRLFAAVGGEAPRGPVSSRPGLLGRVRLLLKPPAPALWGAASVMLMAVVLVIGSVWVNDRLDEVFRSNRELSGRITQVADENRRLLAAMFEQEAQIRDMVSDARYLSSMTASPGVSVNLLRGTHEEPDAWGMVACCAETDDGLAALIAVLNLDELAQDEAYQVWVMTKYQELSVGFLYIDSTGYAQAVIIPGVPFSQIEEIGVTVEPAGGSYDPTGARVLAGEM